MKNTVTNLKQSDQPPNPPTSDRQMLIRFGKLAWKVANSCSEAEMKLIIELLEQAALLELSVEEVLSSLKA